MDNNTSVSFSRENISIYTTLMPFDIWKPWKGHASCCASIPRTKGCDITATFNGKGIRSGSRPGNQ